MKTINVNGTKYNVSTKDDMIFLTHKLIQQGYSIKQIAEILGITEKTVKKYLQDCW